MKIRLLFITCILGFILAACNDDAGITNTNQSKSVKELIQQKWNIEFILDKNYKGSSTELDYIDTFISGTGNTIEFRTDNRVIVNIQGFPDTSAYSIISDQTIRLDGDDSEITTINEKEFVITYKERVDTPYFDNIVKMYR